MTRESECLAVHDGLGGSGAFAVLRDGRILHQTRRAFHVSSDSGLSWSESWVAQYADSGRMVDWGDGSLVELRDGSMGFVGRITPPPPADLILGPRPDNYEARQEWKSLRKQPGRDDWHVAFWKSSDGGRSWSQPVRLIPRMEFGLNCLNNGLIRIASGRLIVPLYIAGDEYTGRNRCFVCYSDDDGATWRSSGRVPMWISFGGARIRMDGWEPSIVEVKPGKLLMFIRTKLGRLYQAWSHDHGETWTEAEPSQLASSPAPAALAKVPGTSDLLAVWNQTGIREGRDGLWRARLSTAISRDEGRTWTQFQNIESSLEGTHVEPDPIRPEWVVKDINYRFDDVAEYPKLTFDDARTPPLYGRLHGLFTYPSVIFHGGNLLVGHADVHWNEQGKVVSRGRLRVVPISWLYGGAKVVDERSSNPEGGARSSYPAMTNDRDLAASAAL